MKYSDFESEMKAKLNSEEIQLDTTLLVEQLTGSKKRKRWILPLSLLVIAFGAILAFNLQSEAPNTNSGIQLSSESSPANSTSKASLVDASKASQLSKVSDIKTNNKGTSSSVTQFQENNNKESNTSSTKSISTSGISSKNTSLTKNTLSESNPLNIENDLNNAKDKSTEFEEKNNRVNNESVSFKEPTSSDKLVYSTNETTDESLIIVGLPNADDQRSAITLHAIEGLGNLSAVTNEVVEIDKNIECPTFKVKSKLFDIEILGEAGYMHPFKSLSTLSPDPTETQNLRRLNENPREGWHAAIYAKAIGRKVPFYIQSGVSTDLVTERMDLSYSYTERDTTVGIISITKSENGDTITAIYGDIITETEISGQQRKHYRLQSYDVPVLIGYEFGLGRFSLGVDAGFNFNVQVRSSGNILATPVSFESIDDVRPFKSNVGISYIGGLSLGYYLTPRSKLYLNVRGRAIPDTFSNNNNNLSQKYTLVGANIGYGYLF